MLSRTYQRRFRSYRSDSDDTSLQSSQPHESPFSSQEHVISAVNLSQESSWSENDAIDLTSRASSLSMAKNIKHPTALLSDCSEGWIHMPVRPASQEEPFPANPVKRLKQKKRTDAWLDQSGEHTKKQKNEMGVDSLAQSGHFSVRGDITSSQPHSIHGVNKTCSLPNTEKLSSLLRNALQTRASDSPVLSLPSSSLMEAQESGEMIERMDEAAFAMDGLKPGQPLRVQRSSISTMASLCAPAECRRLLHSNGTSALLVEALSQLPMDDSVISFSSAVIILFLASDGQNKEILSTPFCVKFLLQLLKIPQSKGDLCTVLPRDSSADRVENLVHKYLVSEDSLVESIFCNQYGISTQMIALLAIEKACDFSVIVQGNRGSDRLNDFQVQFRKLEGAEAIACLATSLIGSILKVGNKQFTGSDLAEPFAKDIVLLLRCLKVLESLTFLSKESQMAIIYMHVPCLPRMSTPHGFLNSLLNAINKLSELAYGPSLLKKAGLTQQPATTFPLTDLTSLEQGHKNMQGLSRERLLLKKRSTWNFYGRSWSPSLPHEKENSPVHMGGNQLTFKRLHEYSSTPDFQYNSSKSVDCIEERPQLGDEITEYLDDWRTPPKQNGPSPWTIRNNNAAGSDPYVFDVGSELILGRRGVVSLGEEIPDLSDASAYVPNHISRADPFNFVVEEERSWGNKNVPVYTGIKNNVKEGQVGETTRQCSKECLLSACKVLMNVTNQNEAGCKAVGQCGGLSMVASILPSCCPSLMRLCLDQEVPGKGQHVSRGRKISDEEIEAHADEDLDLLLAILGVLVNLVEQDKTNRAHLADMEFEINLVTWSGEHSNDIQLEESSKSNNRVDILRILCSLFEMKHGGSSKPAELEGDSPLNEIDEEAAILEGQREAENLMVEAHAALLLAILSQNGEKTRSRICRLLPGSSLRSLAPVLKDFVAFHEGLNVMDESSRCIVLGLINHCEPSSV